MLLTPFSRNICPFNMKFFILFQILFANGQTQVKVKEIRRYRQLNTMAQVKLTRIRFFGSNSFLQYYWDNYDEKKFWGYGCNCLSLTDRPMSSPGRGQPVDDLDRLCHQYKQCQKCAQRIHGKSCIGEKVSNNNNNCRLYDGRPKPTII